MSVSKVSLGILMVLIVGAFSPTPILAMKGVDNLKVDGSCSPVEKAAVVDAFRAANLLVRFSWNAVGAILKIAEHENFEHAPNYVTDKYTRLEFDHERIVNAYTKVFGAFDKTIWNVINRKYAVVTPLTFEVTAVCELANNEGCSHGQFAYLENTKISVCPKFFNYSLEEAKKLALYEAVEEIELFRTGVIVHELMHLNFMNTRAGVDLGYHLDSVLRLPPSKAKENPDSYHVFSLLSYGFGVAPKCALVTDAFCNCGSGMSCR